MCLQGPRVVWSPPGGYHQAPLSHAGLLPLNLGLGSPDLILPPQGLRECPTHRAAQRPIPVIRDSYHPLQQAPNAQIRPVSLAVPRVIPVGPPLMVVRAGQYGVYSWVLSPAEATFLLPCSWDLPLLAPNPTNLLLCLLETGEIMAGSMPPRLQGAPGACRG